MDKNVCLKNLMTLTEPQEPMAEREPVKKSCSKASMYAQWQVHVYAHTQCTGTHKHTMHRQ